MERGKEPLIPLDRSQAIAPESVQREDTAQFLERMWDIEAQVAEKLAKTNDHYEKLGKDRGRVAAPYKTGDHVWLSTKGITMPWDKDRKSKKLTARYYGPFEVLRQTSPVTYELRLPLASNIHPIFHVELLKPYHKSEGHKATALPSAKATDAEEYEIESILAHKKTKGGKNRYLVKWKGYTFEESTWEPAQNFKSSTLHEYHAALKAEKEDESTSEEED